MSLPRRGQDWPRADLYCHSLSPSHHGLDLLGRTKRHLPKEGTCISMFTDTSSGEGRKEAGKLEGGGGGCSSDLAQGIFLEVRALAWEVTQENCTALAGWQLLPRGWVLGSLPGQQHFAH